MPLLSAILSSSIVPAVRTFVNSGNGTITDNSETLETFVYRALRGRSCLATLAFLETEKLATRERKGGSG